MWWANVTAKAFRAGFHRVTHRPCPVGGIDDGARDPLAAGCAALDRLADALVVGNLDSASLVVAHRHAPPAVARDVLGLWAGVLNVIRNARLAALHSFFRFAALRHPEHTWLIQRVLAIPQKRAGKGIVPFLTKAEVEALLGAPDR